nr:MAG TPA_asm: Light-harvesting protein [Caudoviricetes sp.]
MLTQGKIWIIMNASEESLSFGAFLHIIRKGGTGR